MKTTFMANPNTIERKWYVVDAEGKTLGRLAAEVAKVLRGKNKPTFTPHVDTGDHVIVVNAEKIRVTGKKLELSLGFSHPVIFDIPEGIEIKVEKQTALAITGPSKELVGQVAAKIRSFRPPEPYLAKGVRYAGEHIRRKAGKSAGK